MFAFIELHPFAAVRDKYFNDDEFAALQLYLAEHPHEAMLSLTPTAAGNCDGGLRDVASGEACESFISFVSTPDRSYW